MANEHEHEQVVAMSLPLIPPHDHNEWFAQHVTSNRVAVVHTGIARVYFKSAVETECTHQY
jgi:hypothetical protein